MVNTELHCVQWFIQYIQHVTTLMLDNLPGAAVSGHEVHFVLLSVKECSKVFDYSVGMLSITRVLGCDEFGLRI
jgi:hypothetical protein